MSLAQHIHTLTRPHLPSGATIGTQPVPPLLEELDHAVHPAPTGRQSTSRDETPLPISAGAVDLQQTITNQAVIDLWDMRGITLAKPRALADVIQAFDPPVDAEWSAYLERITGEWCDSIRGLVNPRKPRYKMHRPCPACGLLFSDNEHTPALSANFWDEYEHMMHPSKWDASCGACGAEWAGDQLQALAPQLSTDKSVDLSTSGQRV